MDDAILLRPCWLRLFAAFSVERGATKPSRSGSVPNTPRSALGSAFSDDHLAPIAFATCSWHSIRKCWKPPCGSGSKRYSPLPDSLAGVSLDGKTLCNTLSAHERNVHLLSLFDQAVGGVLGQQAVDPTTNEAKAAFELLKAVVLEGRLITGDAMFCQRDLCQEIVQNKGDYLLVVKDNQPELKAAIEAEFRPGFSPRYGAAATRVTL
jgi:hypothetical protein